MVSRLLIIMVLLVLSTKFLKLYILIFYENKVCLFIRLQMCLYMCIQFFY